MGENPRSTNIRYLVRWVRTHEHDTKGRGVTGKCSFTDKMKTQPGKTQPVGWGREQKHRKEKGKKAIRQAIRHSGHQGLPKTDTIRTW